MRNMFRLFGLLVILGFVAMSCSRGKSLSATTGQPYNSPDNGDFEVVDYVEQETGPGLVLIEGGTFTMGRVEQDVMYDWNSIPRRVTVSSFYMDETEVRNVDYREYLHWLTRVFNQMPEVYREALPDTLVWRRRLAFNEPYVDYYFRHPAYHYYPVVGINWNQANKYCDWRTDRVNEQILINQGIFEKTSSQAQSGADNFNTEAYLAGQYKGQVKKPKRNSKGEERQVKIEDGIFLPKYRLPTEAEWEYAAYGLIGNSVDERIFNRKIYPWNGHYLRMDEKDDRGQMRANFKRGRGDLMGVAGYLNDNASIPNRVDSYWPNDFGLYCMAGNVNEWVLDVYRPLSFVDMEDFNPFRGNQFQTVDRNQDGTAKEKNQYGQIPYRDVSAEESMNRYNYKKSDNRNYNDGDIRSSVKNNFDWLDADTAKQANNSARMYYQGINTKKEKVASLVTDQSRIYKGGGWRDRAYWMSPGTRRFLDQNLSTDDIGFRCAMIRVGGNPANGKRK